MSNPNELNYINMSGNFVFNFFSKNYVIDLNQQILSNAKKSQYAQDSIILTYNVDLRLVTNNPEQSLKNVTEYNGEFRPMLNNPKDEINTVRVSKKQLVDW